MGLGRIVLISVLLGTWEEIPAAEINQKAYRRDRHRMFVSAYDNLILKLNAFADAYRPGAAFPSKEARAVRKAWKKLASAEPWFRDSSRPAAEVSGCFTGTEPRRTLSRNYANFIAALDQFLERYVANHATVFPADDVAAVRRSWHCLVLSIPAFQE